MDYKSCGRCGQSKPVDNFAFNRARKDGRANWCKSCANGYNRQIYHDPNHGRRRQMLEANQVTRVRNKTFVRDYLRSHPCVDCGEADIIVLDFDHVRGKKTLEVTRMAAGCWSLKSILEEIEKCEVRCANCHRRVTRRREHEGWWAARYLNPDSTE